MKTSTVNMEAVLSFQNDHKWTDAQLADRMGVSRPFVCRVKQGTRQPSASFIHGLVRAGMHPEEIFLLT